MKYDIDFPYHVNSALIVLYAAYLLNFLCNLSTEILMQLIHRVLYATYPLRFLCNSSAVSITIVMADVSLSWRLIIGGSMSPYHKTFRHAVQPSFVFADGNYYWPKEIPWFISANSSCCWQKQMKIEHACRKINILQTGANSLRFPQSCQEKLMISNFNLRGWTIKGGQMYPLIVHSHYWISGMNYQRWWNTTFDSSFRQIKSRTELSKGIFDQLW